jgi:excisionase family DNA binding protein
MKQIILYGITLEELLLHIEQLIDAKLNIKSKQNEKETLYITRKEVAKLLKISLPTLHDYTKMGWLKSYRIGNRVLYKESDVIQSIENVSALKHKKGKT